MPTGIELEVQQVRLDADRAPLAEVIVCQRADHHQPALQLRIASGEAHLLAHELQGHETPRSLAVATLGDVVACLGGRLSAVYLSATPAGQVIAMLKVDLSGGCVDFQISPGQALAIAVRLGVTLLGDARLFAPPTGAPAVPHAAVDSPTPGSTTTQTDPITQFLNSLDLSGLGA